MLTLAEYLEDYAKPNLVEKGWKTIENNLKALNGSTNIQEIRNRLERIKKGERDLYF